MVLCSICFRGQEYLKYDKSFTSADPSRFSKSLHMYLMCKKNMTTNLILRIVTLILFIFSLSKSTPPLTLDERQSITD